MPKGQKRGAKTSLLYYLIKMTGWKMKLFGTSGQNQRKNRHFSIFRTGKPQRQACL
jgi:hypothetical protein